MSRARVRDLGVRIGKLETGPHNSITDVPGVLVGHTTVIRDIPTVARTGVTVVMPCNGEIWHDNIFAGVHILNGNGDACGLPWVHEFGTIGAPIVLANTSSIGLVRDSVASYAREQIGVDEVLPVVLETSDNWLSDSSTPHVSRENVYEAIITATDGPIAEGSIGGGTSGICHDFKGGIGTSSRVVQIDAEMYTVGVLVQTNYGDRQDLTINGVPVGAEIPYSEIPSGWSSRPTQGSVIVVLGTDAPLLPLQCKRLAQRAVIGLARVGCMGHFGSGDIIVSFATGNCIPAQGDKCINLVMLRDEEIDPFINATVEAVEEAVVNSMTAAETMTGYSEHTAYALPIDRLTSIMTKYRGR
jgi:D-aminopeptidase